MERMDQKLEELIGEITQSEPKSKEPDEETVKKQIRRFKYDGYTDEFCEDAVWQLARYCAGKSNKGLFLAGSVGTGKTYFCELFINAPMLTANEIVRQYEEMGFTDAFREWFHRHYNAPGVFIPPRSVVIDDLGSEPVGRRYGDRREVLGDLIAECYVNWQKHGTKYYITCNLTGQEVQERYGARIIDRLQHMCEVVKFEGSSARLQF